MGGPPQGARCVCLYCVRVCAFLGIGAKGVGDYTPFNNAVAGAGQRTPDWVLIWCTENHEPQVIRQFLRLYAPTTAVHGCTCVGSAFTEELNQVLSSPSGSSAAISMTSNVSSEVGSLI